MNILLIENRPQADELVRYNPNFSVYEGDLDQMSVEEVASDVKQRYADRTDVYVIQSAISICGSNLIENTGIKLLKLLRLHHINNHVIMLSYKTREKLISSDLRNAILTSEGVSFIRLGEMVIPIDENTTHQTANPKELCKLFRVEYNPDDRHFEANMFGVWQLMRVQDAYESLRAGDNGIFTPDTAAQNDYKLIHKKVEKYINSYHGLLVRYLSHQDEQDLEKQLRKATANRTRQANLAIIKDATASIQSIDKERANVEIQIEAIKKLATTTDNESELKPNPWKDMLALFRGIEGWAEKKMNERVMQALEDYTKKAAQLDQEKRRYLDLLDQAKKDTADPNNDIDLISNIGLATDQKIIGVKDSLLARRPIIIYVDDLAKKGWQSILQRIVFGDSDQRLRAVVPGEYDTPDDIVNQITEAGIDKADLLILDLRLKGETGFVDPAQLSGFQVLKLLNERNLRCPIMVFTASNKVWSLKEAFKGNVMSFWVKGGMEQYESDSECVNSYLDLLDQINTLTYCSWLFGVLADLKTMAKQIAEAEKPFWWEILEKEFVNGNHRKLTDKTDVIDIINKTVELTQANLRQLFFGLDSISMMDICRQLVVQLSYALEEIVRCEEEYDKSSITCKMTECVPNAYYKNYTLRNEAVHEAHSRITAESIVKYRKAVEWYLFSSDPNYVPPVNPEVNDLTRVVYAPQNDATTDPNLMTILLTPVGDRLDLLKKGKEIRVAVVSVIENPSCDGCFYNFYIQPKSLTTIGSLVKVSDHEDIIENVSPGDVIVVKRPDPKNNDLQIVKYYKAHKPT